MGETTPASGGGWEPPSIEHLQTLLPQYEISRLLGHGGMGAVYEGVQSNLDRKVAIKILPETLGENVDGLNFTDRFKLEAKSMANLDHPGIISVYDFGETREGQLYFVMEFIDGMDIHQYLKHHGGKLPPESAIAIVAHVLDALGYAHERGIIHRDIKPANIMIKSDGRVKVADFGLVKRLSDSGEGTPDSAALTMTNVAIGTPDFVAPESLEMGRVVDHRADLYAIGVMFYQLLTGTVPRGNFKPPSGKIPALDPRLDTIVMRAMEADPEDRYASADEFRAAIDEILSSPVPEEQDTGPVTPGGKRLHITSVKKKITAPGGSTGPVKGQAASHSHSARGTSQQGKKTSLVLIAAIVVIGGAVIGGASLFFGGGSGGGDDEKGSGKKGSKVAEVRKPKAGEKSKSGKTTPTKANPKPATPPKPEPEPEPKVVQKPTTPEPAVPDPTPPTPKPELTKPEPAPAPTPEDPVAQRLAEIDGQYREFFEKPYADALATLNQQFAGALKREEQAASQTGNLDLVLAFQNEAKQIGNGQGAGPADAADVPPKLKQWRTTWHTQHQKLLDEQAVNRKNAHVARDLALDRYQQVLVKARDIAAAQRVKALREQLAANPNASVAAVVVVGVPPGPVRSGTASGNPLLPVITMVPKLEYPPKRPERVGELIRIFINKKSDPEVIATDVVDFRVSRNAIPIVFVLSSNGQLNVVGENESTVYSGFADVSSSLTDIVSFDIGEHYWGVALSSSGKLTSWGNQKSLVVSETSSISKNLTRVVALSHDVAAGLTESGSPVGWPDSSGVARWLATNRSVADVRTSKPNNRTVGLVLTERGQIEVSRPEAFEDEDQRTIEGIRNAVAIATRESHTTHPATLILLDSGEIVPVGWPRSLFPEGNPLPPDLPKDIEDLFVASVPAQAGKPENFFGGVRSRSQGWIFFGKGIDKERLEEVFGGCFQIAFHNSQFFGLRDPQVTAKLTPPSPKPPTPRPAGNPLQPVITEVPKLEYPPKRPQRVGELVRADLDKMDAPEVIATEVVDFRVADNSDKAALVLTKSGNLAVTKGKVGSFALGKIETVAPQLKEIVSLDLLYGSGANAVALDTGGQVTTWGMHPEFVQSGAVEVRNPCRVFTVTNHTGVAVDSNGKPVVWTSDPIGRWLVELRGVADIRLMRHSTPVALALTDRGDIEVSHPKVFPEEDLKQLRKIRDAVLMSVTARVNSKNELGAALILRATGEVVPIRWPRDLYPDGNPLPADLPRDLQKVFVGSVGSASGDSRTLVGAVLSKSRGWIFFGKDMDIKAFEKLAAGCFEIAVNTNTFYGLRDPVKTTPPIPKPALAAAATPLPKLPDPPEWLKKGKETGGKVRVWGSFDGEPLDEREFTKFLNTDDFVEIAVGSTDQLPVVVSKRSDRRGVRVKIKNGKGESDRFREVQAIDRNGAPTFLADGQAFQGTQGPYADAKYEVDEAALAAGHFQNSFIYRDQSGAFRFDGDEYRAAPELYNSVAEKITGDRAQLVWKSHAPVVFWVTADHRVQRAVLSKDKEFDIRISPQSPEPVVQFWWRGNKWTALGESGTVYEGSDFNRPYTEWSPARVIRKHGGGNALQKPDGTWHAFGPDPELNAFINQIGRAIDLDVYATYFKEGKHLKRVVVWIEPAD